jgi:hypothetical protein
MIKANIQIEAQTREAMQKALDILCVDFDDTDLSEGGYSPKIDADELKMQAVFEIGDFSTRIN